MKIEDSGYSQTKILLNERNQITLGVLELFFYYCRNRVFWELIVR